MEGSWGWPSRGPGRAMFLGTRLREVEWLGVPVNQLLPGGQGPGSQARTTGVKPPGPSAAPTWAPRTGSIQQQRRGREKWPDLLTPGALSLPRLDRCWGARGL